ncbi:MAG: alpha/beta fold hydrolase, partial [Thiomonas sp.]
HGYRYEDYAGDVVGLMEGLDLAPPVLLGHSMGGMTAAVVASQVGTAIRGLVLADPTFLSVQRQREVYESDVVEQHRRYLSLHMDEALAEGRNRHPLRRAEIVRLVAEARMKTRIGALDVLTPPNPDYRQLVTMVDIPILLVIADTGIVSLEMARDLQELNPRVCIQQIQDAGHGLQYDQPERFEAVVRPFLRSLAALEPSASCTSRTP